MIRSKFDWECSSFVFINVTIRLPVESCLVVLLVYEMTADDLLIPLLMGLCVSFLTGGPHHVAFLQMLTLVVETNFPKIIKSVMRPLVSLMYSVFFVRGSLKVSQKRPLTIDQGTIDVKFCLRTIGFIQRLITLNLVILFSLPFIKYVPTCIKTTHYRMFSGKCFITLTKRSVDVNFVEVYFRE